MMEPDRSRWVIIYPIYLDSKKTLAEGRRIAASVSCDSPTVSEIAECLAFLNFAHALELEKAYPRDATQRGRIRVQLKSDDGNPVNANIPSRKALMLKVAELVSRRRTKKGAPSASTANANSGKSGKGGRKKK